MNQTTPTAKRNDPREEDNRALAQAGMPYRYDDAGYARCVTCCGQYYFRADRPGQPDCEHYDPFHEQVLP